MNSSSLIERFNQAIVEHGVNNYDPVTVPQLMRVKLAMDRAFMEAIEEAPCPHKGTRWPAVGGIERCGDCLRPIEEAVHGD